MILDKLKNMIVTINIKAVSSATVARLIMLMISMIAWLCKMFGVVPPEVDENMVFNIVITAFGIVAFLQSYWKNNSWTEAAQVADAILDMKKVELKGAEWNEKH